MVTGEPGTGNREPGEPEEPGNRGNGGNRAPGDWGTKVLEHRCAAQCGTELAAPRELAQLESFRELDVWRLGMDLVTEVYRATRQLPRDEFDLRRQLRRAAISIPANIAEGWQRRSRLSYRYHVSVALGSQAELETQLEVAIRCELIGRDVLKQAIEMNDRVGRMLIRLHQRLAPSQSVG